MGVNLRAFLLGGLGVTIAAACAASGGSGSTGFISGAGGSGSGSGGNVLTTGHGGSGNGGSTFAGSGTGGIDIDAACGVLTEKAHGYPVNLYIAFDKSSSMAGDKWNGAKSGLQAFLSDPASAGLVVALNFFPLDGKPATCSQFDYEPAAVDFGKLPGNANALNTAMTNETPDGFTTPIYPALGGAILGAKDYADSNAGSVPAVLLVTDGAPNGPATTCAGVDPTDPTAIAQLATAGVGYGVHTFVVGLPGVDVTIANQIAAAGGTTAAIIVAAGDVQNNFKTALTQVRGQTLPCEFAIPDKVANGTVAPGLVNVLYTPGGGSQAIMPQSPDCTHDGWKYDDPSDPKEIIFCPTTCRKLQSDYNAQVDILLGCATIIN